VVLVRWADESCRVGPTSRVEDAEYSVGHDSMRARNPIMEQLVIELDLLVRS